jgi:hypothetical protein
MRDEPVDGPKDEPVPEHPATWENVVVGEVKKLAGEAIRDKDLAEQGEEQVEAAREVREEFREEHESPPDPSP